MRGMCKAESKMRWMLAVAIVYLGLTMSFGCDRGDFNAVSIEGERSNPARYRADDESEGKDSAVVPEPATAGLMAVGMLAVAAVLLRKERASI